MHSRIKSDVAFETLKLDLQQPTSQNCLKSEKNFESSLQTQKYQGMILEIKPDIKFSPKTRRNQSRYHLESSKILVDENDQENEEHSIWGDQGLLPVGNNKENILISFLELYKYRYERTTKKPMSSYNVIQMAKKLISRHSHSKIKYSGINKLQWIDFRDWSK